MGSRGVTARWLGVLALALAQVSCNPSARHFGGGGGSSTSGGDDSGGESHDGGQSGEAQGGKPTVTTTTPCETEGERGCSGDKPRFCKDGFWVEEPECPMRCSGEGKCACEENARRCEGNTPQRCQEGDWTDDAPCSGETRACTGAGVCAAFVLRSGGLDSFSARPGESERFVLKDQSLSRAPRVCGSKFCVTASVE